MASPRPIIEEWPQITHWVDFFQIRAEKNKETEKNELPVEKQRRESRLRDSFKINQLQSSGPSKKSVVYQWVQDDPQPVGTSMCEEWGYIWRRKKVNCKEVEDYTGILMQKLWLV